MTLETLNFWKAKAITYPIIALSFLMLGCQSFKTTSELQSNFNEQELKDFQTIRSFFIKNMMELNDENFNNEFRFKIKDLEASGFSSVVPKKIEKLFTSISESTFNEIWEIKTQKRSNTQYGSYKYLAPKKNGKYQKFLSAITPHNSMVRLYYDDLLKTENFSHLSMSKYINHNSLDFDLDNTNVQLLFAIHYITFYHDNNITSNLLN